MRRILNPWFRCEVPLPLSRSFSRIYRRIATSPRSKCEPAADTATPSYIGVPERDGLQQLNVLLGDVERTGMLPLEVFWNGQPLCDPSTVRVIPAGPFVPHVWAISDGINVMSESQITSGLLKVTVEQTDHPERFTAELAGVPAEHYDIFCVDPSLPRYEINFNVPPSVPKGTHELRMRLGSRLLGTAVLEIL